MRYILPSLLIGSCSLLTEGANAQCLTTFTDPPGQSAIANGAWDAPTVPSTTYVTVSMTTTAGANTATVSGCNAVLLGATVSGPNVPAGTTISSVACPNVTLSQNATATGSTLHTFDLPAYAQNNPPVNSGIPVGLNCSVCPATFSAPVCAGQYFNYYMCVGNSYSISLCSSATAWNSSITVTNTAGTALASGTGNFNNDGCGTPGGHAQLTFVPTITATYRVRVFEDPCTVNASACGTVSVTCSPAPAAPANDDPANATVLTVGTDCIPAEATTESATQSGGAALPSNCNINCTSGSAGFAGADVWFSLIVPASGEVVVQTELLTAADIAMAAYDGSPGSLTQLYSPGYCGSCNGNTSSGVLEPFLWLTGLNPGSTIYLRVWPQGGAVASGTFSICASEPSAPANDEPCNAVSIEVNPDCEPVAISTLFSTNGAAGMTISPATPSCGAAPQGDVWAMITLPASGGISITTTAGAVGNAALAVYELTSGTACAGTLTEAACASGGAGMPTLEFAGTPGTDIYVRFWSETVTNGAFSVCVQGIAPPVNDDPENAFEVIVDADCSDIYSAWLAGASTVPDPANCEPDCSAGSGGYAGGDVWFTATVPEGGSMTLDATPLAGSLGMAVYNGSAQALIQLNAPESCGSCSYQLGGPVSLNLVGQESGSAIWIRVWPIDGTDNLEFRLCAGSLTPFLAGDCIGSIALCGDTSVVVEPSNQGSQEDLNADNSGCLQSGEHQGVWFNVTTVAAGSMAFRIMPSSDLSDYDFAVWGPFTDAIPCPPNEAPVRCSFAAVTGPTGLDFTSSDLSEGAIGDGWLRRITAASHETYLIYIDNFSQSGLEFDLMWDNQPSNLIDCISTSVSESPSLALVTLTPNPASDAVMAAWPFAGSGTIEVLDAKGRSVLRYGHNGDPRATIAISDLSGGLYTVRLMGRDGRSVQGRFVKE